MRVGVNIVQPHLFRRHTYIRSVRKQTISMHMKVYIGCPVRNAQN